MVGGLGMDTVEVDTDVNRFGELIKRRVDINLNG